MIFPRKKNVQSPMGPWWQSPKQPKSSKGTLVLIALLAGAVGGFLGVNASGGSLNNKVDFVSSTSTIERAPDSVAGIAQRVLPSVVSIDTRTLTGGGSGSGFIFDSNGYILELLQQELLVQKIERLPRGIQQLKALSSMRCKLMLLSIQVIRVVH